MALVTLLKLVWKSFVVLVWPLITLVYPLYASIQAIESNSNADNLKLLTYWVLYALIMLFELTFAKLLEWLPYWPYMRLMVTCWLALPYFDGAVYVYEHFVRPCFNVNPQTLNNWFIPQKEECLLSTHDFLSVAKRYIKENGSADLEELINDKANCNCTEPICFGTVNNAVAATKNEEAAAPEGANCNCTEPICFGTVNNAVAAIKNEEAAGPEGANCNCTEPICFGTVNNAVAATKNEEAAGPEGVYWTAPNLPQTENKTVATSENEATASTGRGFELFGSLGPKEFQKEWTCALCQVRTTSEADLKNHFGGMKHKAKVQELKANKVAAKKKVVSVSNPKNANQPTVAPKKDVSTNGPNLKHIKSEKKVGVNGTGDQFARNNPQNTGIGKKQFVFWCDLCNIRCDTTSVMNSHLSGKKHLTAAGCSGQ